MRRATPCCTFPVVTRPRRRRRWCCRCTGPAATRRAGSTRSSPLADDGGFLVLAVPSRDRTWDAVRDTFGLDVAFIDQAVAWTFAHYAVDPDRVAVAGFSDGASYACRWAWPMATCSGG